LGWISVGKSYHHPVYANVNSISFHYPLDLERTPWQINYLNCGLFFGQHKVQGSDKVSDDELRTSRRISDENLAEMYAKAHLGQDPIKGLLTNVNTLLNGTLPGKQKDILAQFISHHGDEIKKETASFLLGDRWIFHRNIFLPVSLGGMGVLHPTARTGPRTGTRFATTCIQRRLACHLLNSTPMSVSRQAPHPGPVIQAFDDTPKLSYMKKFGISGEIQSFDCAITGFTNHISKRDLALPLTYFASPLEKGSRPFLARKLRSFRRDSASRVLDCTSESVPYVYNPL